MKIYKKISNAQSKLRVNEVNLSRFEVGGSRGFWEMEFLEHKNKLFLFLMAIMNFIHDIILKSVF